MDKNKEKIEKLVPNENLNEDKNKIAKLIKTVKGLKISLFIIIPIIFVLLIPFIEFLIALIINENLGLELIGYVLLFALLYLPGVAPLTVASCILSAVGMAKCVKLEKLGEKSCKCWFITFIIICAIIVALDIAVLICLTA